MARRDIHIPEVSRTTWNAQASRPLSGETQKHLSGSLTEQGHSRTGAQAGALPVALPGSTRPPPKPLPVRPVSAPPALREWFLISPGENHPVKLEIANYGPNTTAILGGTTL